MSVLYFSPNFVLPVPVIAFIAIVLSCSDSERKYTPTTTPTFKLGNISKVTHLALLLSFFLVTADALVSHNDATEPQGSSLHPYKSQLTPITGNHFDGCAQVHDYMQGLDDEYSGCKTVPILLRRMGKYSKLLAPRVSQQAPQDLDFGEIASSRSKRPQAHCTRQKQGMMKLQATFSSLPIEAVLEL